MSSTRNTLLILLFITAACSPDSGDPKAPDAGGSIDEFVSDASPDAPDIVYDTLRVEDRTRPGEGLPLDAVEICDPVGMNCVAFTEIADSSDPGLDYSGVTDGRNAQDDSCEEGNFTKLGADGAFVVLRLSEGELTTGSKVNVLAAVTDCPDVFPGMKPFAVTMESSATGDTRDLGECGGTCTIDVP